MRVKPRALASAGGTAVLLAARLFPLPVLSDAVTGAPAADARLVPSPWHLALTPLSCAADWLTCNTLRGDVLLLALLLLASLAPAVWLWRRGQPRRAVRAFLTGAALAALFIAWTVLGPRPAARLELSDPDLLAVDFHSHSSHSWDARRSFTVARNADWHRRMGFGAWFLTDHNNADGRAESGGQPILDGEELSLYQAHVVLLGGRPVEVSLYQDGLPGLKRFLKDSGPKWGGLAVMSLPEYWRHPWGADLERMPDWGVRGFEVYTASPKALEFPAEKRREIAGLCRSRGLLMAGATDNHGWAQSCCVWNVLRAPGWRTLGREELQTRILASLQSQGADAVRVLARTRGGGGPWSLLRTLSWAQTAAAAAWLWLIPLVFSICGM